MSALFTLAGLVDAVILFTLIECAVLLFHHRRSGAGVAPKQFFANLVSGVCLMLALRCALRDLGAMWVLLWLLLAGIAHFWDMRRRWVRAADATRP